MNQIKTNFDNYVALKYQLYNSLFLTLPIDEINNTGILIPILTKYCEQGLQSGQSPDEIIEHFFKDHEQFKTQESKLDFLFRVIQYVERQVVLLDALEDAAYNKIHTVDGPDSFNNLSKNADDSELLEVLKENAIRIVLTAHPTQFYPGNVLAIITDLTEAIKSNNLEQIRLLMLQLGKTPFFQKQKPTPYDEAVNLSWYLENIFYGAAAKLFSKIDSSHEDNHDINSKLLQFGFWPGGDRDGNPFVTAQTTLDVARRLRQILTKCYYNDIRKLRRRLSFRGVYERMQALEGEFYQMMINPDAKIVSLDKLIGELTLVKEELESSHSGLFAGLVNDLISRVKLFGFYFASIDIRQDSRIIAKTLDAVLEQDPDLLPMGWNEADEKTQVNALFKISGNIDPEAYDDPVINDTLQSFRTIQSIQKENGELGAHRYIISNCRNALDIARVFALARLSGWQNPIKLDVIPLFETIDDLDRAHITMKKIYSNPVYKKHLAERKQEQTIMLGFSDGTKDGGYFSANWNIFRAKENITKLSRQMEISVVFFDGRGGPPARGGGNTQKFYKSLGGEIENKQIQLTIQGQTISSLYGTEESAMHNMEMLLVAGIESRLTSTKSSNLNAEERALLETLSKTSLKKYNQLKNAPQFLPYLQKMSTLNYYAQANIGSRPSKRGSSTELKFEDLRAIPFVGAWSQLKQNVPGFYGVGTSLKLMEEDGKLEECKQLYRNSPFFKALCENSMQSLSKTYFPLTAYMKKDKEFGKFWTDIFNEYKLSCEMLLKVSGQKELLETNQTSKQSIKLRENIVLPLITIQQFALMNIRAKEKSSESENVDTLKKLVVRSLFGNINASRNSA